MENAESGRRIKCKISRRRGSQKEKLEAEGHTIIQRGRKNIRYYVKDYENVLFELNERKEMNHYG